MKTKLKVTANSQSLSETPALMVIDFRDAKKNNSSFLIARIYPTKNATLLAWRKSIS